MSKTQSTTTKSKTGISKDLATALYILAMSFLPYIHDLPLFEGKEGFSGFSSLRVALWAVSLFFVGLSGWVGWFISAKGKRYRFIMLAPIFMLAYQLGVYLFDARNTTSNEFNIKVILNIGFATLITLFYFYNKARK